MSDTSDIIKTVDTFQLENKEKVQALEFYDGKYLILSSCAMALYKSKASFEDPLSSSTLGYSAIPPAQKLIWLDESIIERFSSGFIGLKDQRVILITPNAIQLFSGTNDALRNQQHIAEIRLN